MSRCAVWLVAMCGLVVERDDSGVLEGIVRDPDAKPAAAASVSIGNLIVRTASDGKYRFAKLAGGSYTVRAEAAGFSAAAFGPFTLREAETKQVNLTLGPLAEFFDPPGFVVAGVTETINRGGHGSETSVRSTEELTRAAASLREPGRADLHHSLADVLEKQGDALGAVREYQRAAELSPTENNIFDWGAELLSHRAADQAAEVLAKGARLFPRSSRMLLGLGAADYARGSYQDAARHFFDAVDLNPRDPAPYLFLGKVENAEITQMDGFLQRMKRFSELQPESAEALYDYAASLWRKSAQDSEVMRLLEKTLRLNPRFGDAELLRGIVYASRANFSSAIPCYERAIQAGARPEAHYYLAKAYQRSGDASKARKEFEAYEQWRKTSAAEEERKRNEIQQFVFGLRERQ